MNFACDSPSALADTLRQVLQTHSAEIDRLRCCSQHCRRHYRRRRPLCRMDDTEAKEEVPACRICRSEEEPDAPLYHPCKCTGSIRYCHQDCLVQWLQHSQKKHCELCGFHFVFHKHYTQDMPQGILSTWLYFRYFAWHLVVAASWLIRVAVVSVSWLIFVPYATLRIWTSYIHSCDWFAELVLQKPVASMKLKQTDIAAHSTDSAIAVVSRYIVRELTKDWPMAAGLTIFVIAAFVGVFILREYILNAEIGLNDRENDVVIERAHEDEMQQIGQEALALARERAQRMREVDVDEIVRQDEAQHGHGNVASSTNAPVSSAQSDDDEWEDEQDDAIERNHEPMVWETRMHLEPRRRSPGSLTPAAPPNEDNDEWIDEAESSHEQEHHEHESEEQDQQLAPLPAPADPDDEADENAEGDEEDDEVDDNPEHMAEDIDTLLHAIGLRGTWISLGQNLVLVQMLIIMTMSVCVAVPYGIGRVLGFRVYDMLLLPARALRIVTDPVFELMIDSMFRLLPAENMSAPPAPSVSTVQFAYLSPVRQLVTQATSAVDACTRGGYFWERALCVILGHLYILAGLKLEARFGSLLHGGSTELVGVVVKYYGTVLKCLFLMLLDLVGCPLFYGIFIDWCLMPLFEGASLATLIGYAQTAPVSFTFSHWLSGTVFMFLFAQFLSAIRSVVRPGVMCWIRDNSDPDFQPVTEVVEDKMSTQLRKMAESSVICCSYAMLVLGLSTRLLQQVPGLLPLHWAPLTPRVLVPVDLILLHFGLRIFVKYTRMPRYSRRLLRVFWIWTAKCMRMSAYIMGDDQPAEREHPVYGSWTAWARSFVQHVDSTTVTDGGFVRVPANDRPAPRTAMIIRTDAQGHPVDEHQRELLDKQRAVIDTMTEKPPYTIVYVPPNLRLRTLGIVGFVWALSLTFITLGVGIPLAIGRILSYWNSWPRVHDVYTWSGGFLVLAVLSAVIRAYFYVTKEPRRARPTSQASKVMSLLRSVARVTYNLATLGGVVPLLTGIVLFQYLTFPSADGQVPKFSAWYAWSYGALMLNAIIVPAVIWLPHVENVQWYIQTLVSII